MTIADEKQHQHDLPGALNERLATLRSGSTNWHEWHQTGVMLCSLAESAFIQFGMKRWRNDILDLLAGAQEFFVTALKFVPEDQPLARCAIICDQELARAFMRRFEHVYVARKSWPGLAAVIEELQEMRPSAARNHQLAIAHSFVARAEWWRALGETSALLAGLAQDHEAMATSLFRANLPNSPDGGRAFSSHLLAMALIHERSISPVRTRDWRRRYVLPALRLAMQSGDSAQAARAVIIGLHGNDGERTIRACRDKRMFIREVCDQLEAFGCGE